MKHYLLLLLCFVSISIYGQDTESSNEPTRVQATIISSTTKAPLVDANIVNLNQVIGTTTDDNGMFEIRAKVNDTLHLSYLGYKSIKVRVTNDWIKFGNTEIEMTDLALALEEVVVNQLKLTGYLEVDLKQMLNDLILAMDLGLQNKEAKVNITFPEQALILKGDPFHIRHVFKNLIDNALKYSKESPVINIDAKVNDDGITIKFSDNGIGISKADQEHVFEKFQRVSTGNLHNQAGFGIGLYYSKMIVELHNGAIKLFSELGKGSQFALFFPSPNR